MRNQGNSLMGDSLPIVLVLFLLTRKIDFQSMIHYFFHVIVQKILYALEIAMKFTFYALCAGLIIFLIVFSLKEWTENKKERQRQLEFEEETKQREIAYQQEQRRKEQQQKELEQQKIEREKRFKENQRKAKILRQQKSSQAVLEDSINDFL